MIFFDLDSTLVKIEGINLIAKWRNVDATVSSLTRQSMDGLIPMEEIFEKKIKLTAPSYQDLKKLGEEYIKNLTPKFEETIKSLQDKKWGMGIITGGFDIPAKIVAENLQINTDLVFANKLVFDYDGQFYDFNPKQPLAQEDGKLEVIKQIKNQHKPKKIYFVGDSYSDMRVTPEVTKFIGFGGVVEREKVRKEAKYYVYDPSEILDLID